MYRLCIFDLDGTLLNTIYALTYVTNLTLDAFGLRHVTPEETKRIVGNGYRMQMKRALVLAGMRSWFIMKRRSRFIWRISLNTA